MSKDEIHAKVKALDNATFVAFALSQDGISRQAGMGPRKNEVVDGLADITRDEILRRGLKFTDPVIDYKLGLGTNPIFKYLGFPDWESLASSYR